MMHNQNRHEGGNHSFFKEWYLTGKESDDLDRWEINTLRVARLQQHFGGRASTREREMYAIAIASQCCIKKAAVVIEAACARASLGDNAKHPNPSPWNVFMNDVRTGLGPPDSLLYWLEQCFGMMVLWDGEDSAKGLLSSIIRILNKLKEAQYRAAENIMMRFQHDPVANADQVNTLTPGPKGRRKKGKVDFVDAHWGSEDSDDSDDQPPEDSRAHDTNVKDLVRKGKVSLPSTISDDFPKMPQPVFSDEESNESAERAGQQRKKVSRQEVEQRTQQARNATPMPNFESLFGRAEISRNPRLRDTLQGDPHANREVPPASNNLPLNPQGSSNSSSYQEDARSFENKYEDEGQSLGPRDNFFRRPVPAGARVHFEQARAANGSYMRGRRSVHVDDGPSSEEEDAPRPAYPISRRTRTRIPRALNPSPALNAAYETEARAAHIARMESLENIQAERARLRRSHPTATIQEYSINAMNLGEDNLDTHVPLQIRQDSQTLNRINAAMPFFEKTKEDDLHSFLIGGIFLDGSEGEMSDDESSDEPTHPSVNRIRSGHSPPKWDENQLDRKMPSDVFRRKVNSQEIKTLEGARRYYEKDRESALGLLRGYTEQATELPNPSASSNPSILDLVVGDRLLLKILSHSLRKHPNIRAKVFATNWEGGPMDYLRVFARVVNELKSQKSVSKPSHKAAAPSASHTTKVVEKAKKSLDTEHLALNRNMFGELRDPDRPLHTSKVDTFEAVYQSYEEEKEIAARERYEEIGAKIAFMERAKKSWPCNACKKEGHLTHLCPYLKQAQDAVAAYLKKGGSGVSNIKSTDEMLENPELLDFVRRLADEDHRSTGSKRLIGNINFGPVEEKEPTKLDMEIPEVEEPVADSPPAAVLAVGIAAAVSEPAKPSIPAVDPTQPSSGSLSKKPDKRAAVFTPKVVAPEKLEVIPEKPNKAARKEEKRLALDKKLRLEQDKINDQHDLDQAKLRRSKEALNKKTTKATVTQVIAEVKSNKGEKQFQQGFNTAALEARKEKAKVSAELAKIKASRDEQVNLVSSSSSEERYETPSLTKSIE